MSELKPTFTDVKSRKIVTRLIEENTFEYLAVERISEDGTTAEQILQLNIYDAKRLAQACETFMQRSIARNFAEFSGHLTPTDRADILNEDA
ncbi:hypothetical protein P4N68_08895 [Corynebacterium felinum]|uniref:Uncharacterized protein n=1 Tax=Corynebacterium felinum TaxID=131318 RepID=A0ABU2BCC2_9CORY|nr:MULTISPECIES: hypothetical protein [Corynebacterium]MDF5821193.1 hypothetical protein [Corynebacterium felinum]MDO4760932.1 hypothetical protein [Corynebacterium sp.]MDR7356289.1 hypothetical protein [Corynebacterium felinum]WJY95622.1 hypothetical protein CFELI_10120 [Corynebacterium felinum]